MDGLLAASEVVDAVKVIRDAGTIGLLIFIIVSGAKGWWVFGRTHTDRVTDLKEQIGREREEKNVWKTQAMRGATRAEQAVVAAEAASEAVIKALDQVNST